LDHLARGRVTKVSAVAAPRGRRTL
jgi:hypothetical protein